MDRRARRKTHRWTWTTRTPRAATVVGCLLALATASCTSAPPRFPLRAVYWTDDDAQPVARAPAPEWIAFQWDGVDNTLFEPVSRTLRIEHAGEATNVNALDEVPDSTWFTNRLSRAVLSDERAAEGACAGEAPVPERGVWMVTSGKPDGVSPGFVARGPDGRSYLLKADGVPAELTSTADVVGSRVYWAAGYFTPCNRVAFLRPEDLRLDPAATYEDDLGRTRALTPARFRAVLQHATPGPGGTLRLGASLFVPGRPLGPFRYEGTRAGDPNDVVPHEDRRDLRASRLVAALLGHWDARAQNTFTTWVEPDGESPRGGGPSELRSEHERGARGGYVRHYMLDFGDCLGNVSRGNEAAHRRLGFAGYIDPGQITADWLTLGMITRPWDVVRADREAPLLGYYGDTALFDPEAWRPGYPNAAFVRMTERDGAWMARTLARLTESNVAAIVAQARLSRPAYAERLVRVLMERRARVLSRFLLRVSPLADPEVRAGELCLRDRAAEAGVYASVSYRASFAADGERFAVGSLRAEADGAGGVCMTLPAPSAEADSGALPDDHASRYRAVQVEINRPGATPPTPLFVYLYDLGPARGYALAGLTR